MRDRACNDPRITRLFSEMQTVELVRWLPGVQKVSCTRTLQHYCGLPLSVAKAITDALLECKRPTVDVESAAAARQLIHSLALLRVVARFAEGPGYAPQERFDQGFEQVAQFLPAATAITCRALATHGEWELALSVCLAGIPASVELPPAVEGLLGELAVEFGMLPPQS